MSRFASCAFVLLLAAGIGLATSARAQTDVKIGPRVGIPVGEVSDIGGNFFFGADARFGTEALPVMPNVSFDYYAGFEDWLYAVDLNALYEFGVDNAAFTPYTGGGLGITRSGDNTEIGFNLLGGVRFMLDPVEPFVQVNTTLGGDLSRTGVAVGILFSF